MSAGTLCLAEDSKLSVIGCDLKKEKLTDHSRLKLVCKDLTQLLYSFDSRTTNIAVIFLRREIPSSGLELST